MLQDTVRVHYRFRKVHMLAPEGPLWIPYGHQNIRTFSFAGTIQLRLDAVRAWEYPYDQWCRALRGPARAASAHSRSVNQAKHDYVTFDPVRARKTTNWPSMGPKSLVAHV